MAFRHLERLRNRGLMRTLRRNLSRLVLVAVLLVVGLIGAPLAAKAEGTVVCKIGSNGQKICDLIIKVRSPAPSKPKSPSNPKNPGTNPVTSPDGPRRSGGSGGNGGASGGSSTTPSAGAISRPTYVPSPLITGGGDWLGGGSTIGSCAGGGATALPCPFDRTAPAAAPAPGAPPGAGPAPVAAGAPAPPPPPPPPTNAEWEVAALETLILTEPGIGSAPCTYDGCMGAVGVPVWLWTDPWEPLTEEVTLRGYSITATATPTRVDWSMGDGSGITCTTAGTPFSTSYGFVESPDCGYIYQQQSDNQPGRTFTVTGTMTWDVQWVGAATGSTATTTDDSIAVMIGEYQTVNTK